MNSAVLSTPLLRGLIGFACFVIIVAGMKASAELLAPLFMAAFLALLCAPIFAWLRSKRIPQSAAVALVLLLVVTLVGLFTIGIGTSLNEFSKQLPEFQLQLKDRLVEFSGWLNQRGIASRPESMGALLDQEQLIAMFQNFASGFGNLISNFFLVVIMMAFILLEAAGYPKKLREALGVENQCLIAFDQFRESVKRYLIIKSLVSLATGALIALWLWFQGMDYILVWALLAFLFNYIPNIGSFIAAIPAVLFAMIQMGIADAGITALGFLAVNTIVGNIIEPRYLGRGLGISTLAVFISLLFWGWVLGPVGMILSIPLTMIVKMALDSSAKMRWLAIMISSSGSSELPPAQNVSSFPRACKL